MVKKTEQFKGLKFGKLKIGYKTLITVLGMLLATWLFTKNFSCSGKDGATWTPTQDLKVDVGVDVKR